MNKILVDDIAAIRKWWSVRIGVVGVLLMAGIPEIANQFPMVAPSLLAWFPKNGQQWVPIAGVSLTVAARVISQSAVIDQVRGMFKKKGEGDGNATH